MKASTPMVGLVFLLLLPLTVMADDTSDKLSEITKSLNALKQNNYKTPKDKIQPSSTKTEEKPVSQVEVKLAKRPKVKVPKTKRNSAVKASQETVEDIGSLIRTPDLLTPQIV